MDMIQAYQGYFHAGRFIPDISSVKIPENRRVIVNVLEDVASNAEVAIQQRVDALDKIFAKAKEAENELSEADWIEFENLRSQSNFTRAVDL